MIKDKAIAVQLPVWMAPNDYVSIVYIRDTIHVYFKIWSSRGVYSNQYGMFNFDDVWSIRSCRHKRLKYYPNEEEHNYSSYYLTVPSSSWLDELFLERELSEKDWRKYDKREYQHYVIQSNDYYIEIIASHIEFSVVDNLEWNKL